jgi:hypothetical protein
MSAAAQPGATPRAAACPQRCRASKQEHQPRGSISARIENGRRGTLGALPRARRGPIANAATVLDGEKSRSRQRWERCLACEFDPEPVVERYLQSNFEAGQRWHRSPERLIRGFGTLRAFWWARERVQSNGGSVAACPATTWRQRWERCLGRNYSEGRGGAFLGGRSRRRAPRLRRRSAVPGAR